MLDKYYTPKDVVEVFSERVEALEVWSNENDTVLDCFSGIATTGIACLNTNRKFIGIELDDNTLIS